MRSRRGWIRDDGVVVGESLRATERKNKSRGLEGFWTSVEYDTHHVVVYSAFSVVYLFVCLISAFERFGGVALGGEIDVG